MKTETIVHASDLFDLLYNDVEQLIEQLKQSRLFLCQKKILNACNIKIDLII